MLIKNTFIDWYIEKFKSMIIITTNNDMPKAKYVATTKLELIRFGNIVQLDSLGYQNLQDHFIPEGFRPAMQFVATTQTDSNTAGYVTVRTSGKIENAYGNIILQCTYVTYQAFPV